MERYCPPVPNPLRIPHVRPGAVTVLLLAGTVLAATAAGAGDPDRAKPGAATKSAATARPPATRGAGPGAAPAPAPAPAPGPAPTVATAPVGSGGILKLSFQVKGMVCMLCTRGVEESIKRLPGVASVTADLATGRVDVTAQDRHSLDIQQVRDRAARAGFPVIGETDVEARGRFEIGAERRLTFKPAGGVYSWQVLESTRLLALTRAYPGLRGDFILGFRLHEKPPWKRPAINITAFESATPVQRAAGGS